MNNLQSEPLGTDYNQNNVDGNDETLSLVEDTFGRCTHRHAPSEGPHAARELIDGGHSFATADCQLIGKDGKTVMINRLHAVSMSQFLSVALLNTNFIECHTKRINLPLFTSTEILDTLEMSNLVVYFWLDHHKVLKLKHINISCAFNMLRVASFFFLEHLINALSLLIETEITCDKLIEGYRFAQITDATLAKRLWRKILTDFAELYTNNTFIRLSPTELKECFLDAKLNIRVAQDFLVLKKYRAASIHGYTPIDYYTRKQEIAAIFGDETGSVSLSRDIIRIPHEVIIAQAGWSESGPTSKVEMYDYHRNEWISPSKPEFEEIPRAYHGIAVVDKGILCMGGFNGRTYFRSTAFYDFEEMAWSPVCSMVEPRCYVSLAKLDEYKLIACGGHTGQTRLKTSEIYTYTTNQWLKAATMNHIRSDARAVTTPEKNRVYVVGGFDGRECHNTVEYYCAERDQWIVEKGIMNSKRSGVGAVAINSNVLVAVGGYNGIKRLLSSECYDIREGQWHQLSSMNSSRSNFGIACLEDEPWVIGGYNANRTVAECERYDIKMNRWIPMPSMNVSRSAVACCVVRNVDWIEKIFEAAPAI